MTKYLIVTTLIVLLSGCTTNRDTASEEAVISSLNTNEEPAFTPTTATTEAPFDNLQILKPSVPSIAAVYQSDGIFCLWSGTKFGFLQADGKEIAPFIFDVAYPFQEGLACVMKEGKYGFIDQTGKEAISFIYDQASPFSEGLAYFEREQIYGFINSDGNEVFQLTCDSVSSFKEERAFFSIDGKYGYIDRNGQPVIHNRYDDAGYFKDGLAIVRKGIGSGVIDIDGQEVIPLQYDQVQVYDTCIRATKNGQETDFDFLGNEIIAPPDPIVTTHGAYNIFKVNDHYGISDQSGNTVLSPFYDQINFVGQADLWIVGQNEKYGVVNWQGELAVSLKYDFISIPADPNSDTGYAYIKLDDHYGVLNLSDFTECITPIYDSIDPFREGHAVVSLDGNYGLIDEVGNIILPMGEYDSIFWISDFLLALKKDDRYYLANYHGETVSSNYYQDLQRPSQTENILIFKINNKVGLLDSNGNELIPASYDQISSSAGSVYHADTSFIATNYDEAIQDHIITVGTPPKIDLSNLVLANHITPKLPPYHELAQHFITHSYFADTYRPLHGITTVKLFHATGYENPILYFHIQPESIAGFPQSDSTFYYLDHNEAKVCVRAEECGGSIRGNYVQLFFEKETGDILLGTEGFYGGFGGYASDYRIYRNNQEFRSMQWIGQTSSNFLYDDSYLLNNAHLFYDHDGIPLSKETILEAEYMAEYLINEKTVSVDQFNGELEKYIIIPMQTYH